MGKSEGVLTTSLKSQVNVDFKYFRRIIFVDSLTMFETTTSSIVQLG